MVAFSVSSTSNSNQQTGYITIVTQWMLQEALRYWNPITQEAYASPIQALQRLSSNS